MIPNETTSDQSERDEASTWKSVEGLAFDEEAERDGKSLTVVAGGRLAAIMREIASSLDETEDRLDDWLAEAAQVVSNDDWSKTNNLAVQFGQKAAEIRANLRVLDGFDVDPYDSPFPPTPEEFMEHMRPFVEASIQQAFDMGVLAARDIAPRD